MNDIPKEGNPLITSSEIVPAQNESWPKDHILRPSYIKREIEQLCLFLAFTEYDRYLEHGMGSLISLPCRNDTITKFLS